MPLRSSLPSVPHFLLRHLAKQLQTPTPVSHAESAVEGQVVGRNLVVRGGPGKEHGPKSKKTHEQFFPLRRSFWDGFWDDLVET